MKLEIWKPVVGFEDYYEVSSFGRIRTVERKVWFTSKKGNRFQRTKISRLTYIGDNGTGYKVVWLTRNWVNIVRTVHSLVAEAFIGPRPPKYDICHNDGVRAHNIPSNLRYDTRRNNHLDARIHGTVYNRGNTKLTPEDIHIIRSLKKFSIAREIAFIYKVAPITILRIWRNESWMYVK